MPRVSRTRPRVDDSPLSREFGQRLRRARLAARLTQQQLADDRYTKAYVSALENGLSRPSMAALNHFSRKLGIPASKLIDDEPVAWARIEADLALASGRWDDAVAAYGDLLEAAPSGDIRAELLSGKAEALVRRGQGREAAAAAAEAAEHFRTAGREPETALAEYWLSAAQYQMENTAEARALLQAILARVRGGLKVEPGFHLRLVMALSSLESRDGNHAAALGYLEEVRGLAGSLDDRRRASYLYDLAYSYRETGDLEAAVRAGIASLELFRQAEAEREAAMLENDLALSYLALGNGRRADELIASARATLERLDDEWSLSTFWTLRPRLPWPGATSPRQSRWRQAPWQWQNEPRTPRPPSTRCSLRRVPRVQSRVTRPSPGRVRARRDTGQECRQRQSHAQSPSGVGGRPGRGRSARASLRPHARGPRGLLINPRPAHRPSRATLASRGRGRHSCAAPGASPLASRLVGAAPHRRMRPRPPGVSAGRHARRSQACTRVRPGTKCIDSQQVR